MRLLIILLGIILLGNACNETASSNMRRTKAARKVIQVRKADTLQWQLVRSIDPYNGGTITDWDTANPKFLSFLRNGTFIEKDKYGLQIGQWTVNKQGDRLRLAHTERNGTSIPKESWEQQFRYHLIQRTADTLILGIQGRHGILKRIYLKYDPLQRGRTMQTDTTQNSMPSDSILQEEMKPEKSDSSSFRPDSLDLSAFEAEAEAFDSLAVDSIIVHDSAGIFFPPDSATVMPKDSLIRADSTARLDSIRPDTVPKDQD